MPGQAILTRPHDHVGRRCLQNGGRAPKSQDRNSSLQVTTMTPSLSARLNRIALAVAVLAAALSTSAAAYNGCDKYRFGSQDWWFCMSDKDGER